MQATIARLQQAGRTRAGRLKLPAWHVKVRFLLLPHSRPAPTGADAVRLAQHHVELVELRSTLDTTFNIPAQSAQPVTQS